MRRVVALGDGFEHLVKLFNVDHLENTFVVRSKDVKLLWTRLLRCGVPGTKGCGSLSALSSYVALLTRKSWSLLPMFATKTNRTFVLILVMRIKAKEWD
jgi:hypothetical protein